MKTQKMDDAARKEISMFRRFHPDLPKAATVRRFTDIGYSRSSVHRVIKLVDNGQSVSPKKKSGRPKVRLTDSERVMIRRETAGKVAKSYRRLAEKYQKSPPTIKRILTDMNIIREKRKIIPKVTPAQEQRQRQRLKELKMEELNIRFVPKEENPPATPQLRAIETFWAHLKGRVY